MQADLSLRWVHIHFVDFVVLWLNSVVSYFLVTVTRVVSTLFSTSLIMSPPVS